MAEIWWIQGDFDLAPGVHMVIIRLKTIQLQLVRAA
jgi:hypothetical protein